MPEAHYTNQPGYSTASVSATHVGSLDAPAPSRLCVENRSRKKSVQNPYKSDHFRECEFSTLVTPITYSLNALKRTGFPAAPRPPSSLGHSSFFRISSLVIRHW